MQEADLNLVIIYFWQNRADTQVRPYNRTGQPTDRSGPVCPPCWIYKQLFTKLSVLGYPEHFFDGGNTS
jgi:hypothetical protein